MLYPTLYRNVGYGDDIESHPEGDLLSKHELIAWLEDVLKEKELAIIHVQKFLDFLESTTYRYKPVEPKQ